MKRLSAFFFFSTLCTFAFGQAAIKGVLVDNSEKTPIEFASVALYDQSDKSLVAGVVTDANGAFELSNIKPGKYYLEAQFMGFATEKIDDINLTKKQSMDLGTIMLFANEKLLEDIEISGDRVTTMHKVDRQVFEASQYQSSQGGTATDVLRNLPSVSINSDGTLMVRGTSGFVVLLNGKPIQSDVSMLLDQLPANAVQSIEVITAPSAKYDSEGKAGIINITTLKSVTDGVFAQVNTKIGMPSIQPYDNKENPVRFGGDFTLNYRKNKWDVSLGASYLRNDISGRREGDVWTEIGDKRTEFPSDGERSFDEYNYSGRLAVGFHPNANNDFNFGFYAGKRSKDRLADIYYNNTTYRLPSGEQIGAIDYYNHNLRIRTGDFALGSMDYTHIFKNKSKISASFLYEYTLLGGPTTNQNLDYNWPQEQEIYDDEYNTNDNPLHGSRLNIDYEWKPWNIGQLTIGYQYRNLDHTGDFLYEAYNFDTDEWKTVYEYSSNLNLRRKIHSGYADFSGKAKKWSYGAGIRMEAMDRKLDYLSSVPGAQTQVLYYDYVKFFPSARLQYDVYEDLILKAAYSKRVERTTTFKMNPFKEKEHSETLEQGDANLLPEFIDMIEVGIVKDFENHSIFGNLYYRNTVNTINRVNTVDSDSVLNRIYTNVGNGQAYGFELGADLKLAEWWAFNLGGTIYHYQLDGFFNVDQIHTSAWQHSVNVNTTFDVTKTMNIQFTLNYLSDRITAQGQDSKFYSPNLTVTKTFLDDRLTANIQWLNMDMGLLGTNEQRITTSGHYIDPADDVRKAFYTTTNYVYEVDMIMVNLSFKFNKLKNSAKFIKSEFGEKEF